MFHSDIFNPVCCAAEYSSLSWHGTFSYSMFVMFYSNNRISLTYISVYANSVLAMWAVYFLNQKSCSLLNHQIYRFNARWQLRNKLNDTIDLNQVHSFINFRHSERTPQTISLLSPTASSPFSPGQETKFSENSDCEPYIKGEYDAWCIISRASKSFLIIILQVVKKEARFHEVILYNIQWHGLCHLYRKSSLEMYV